MQKPIPMSFLIEKAAYNNKLINIYSETIARYKKLIELLDNMKIVCKSDINMNYINGKIAQLQTELDSKTSELYSIKRRVKL